MTNSRNELTGSWNAEVSTPNQGKFPALLTFSADGAVLASESPTPFESTGHGNWISHADGTVVFTFVALFGSQEGKHNGRLKVVGKMQWTPADQRWQGPFKIDLCDANDQVTYTDRGTFNLTRIAVEALD